jgi:hypothetical protein
MTQAELFAFLFDPPADEESDAGEADATVAGWVGKSRRFHAFLVENRGKVRKKRRLARSAESRQSLLLELNIARCLVEDARCRVEYEKYGQGGERSPDLTVTFRTHTGLNLEATRVQRLEGGDEADGRAEKLIRIVCEKFGQVVPKSLNALVVAVDAGSMTEDEVNAAMKSLKRRVERREGDLLARVGCDDPADFFKQFQWLNGIVLCASTAPAGAVLWINPQARTPLTSDLQRLLKAALA